MQEFVKRRASHNTIKPITVLNLNKSIHQENKMACKFISGVLFRPRKDGKDTSSDAIHDSKITERLISNTEGSNEFKWGENLMLQRVEQKGGKTLYLWFSCSWNLRNHKNPRLTSDLHHELWKNWHFLRLKKDFFDIYEELKRLPPNCGVLQLNQKNI